MKLLLPFFPYDAIKQSENKRVRLLKLIIICEYNSFYNNEYQKWAKIIKGNDKKINSIKMIWVKL